MRILSRRFKRGRRQINNLIHELTEEVKDSVFIAKRFCPSWSGIIVFDGKVIRVYDELAKNLKVGHRLSKQEVAWLNKKVWLCGIDYETGDLPHYELADDETRIDLILYFQTLKEIGYPLRVLVSDGSPEIPYAARKVFGQKILHQLCTRHFIEGLKRHAGEAQENSRIQKLILLIQSIIEAENLDEAGERLVKLKSFKRKTQLENELVNLFKLHAPELSTHLFYPKLNIPHTSNDIENLFRQLNLRVKTIGRFHKYRYARNYLKAWALMRRFTKFTDCRNAHKWRNGKAPITLAGANIKDINYLDL